MRGLILTALVWICVVLPASITLAATPAPDTILFNGKIFTAEGQEFVQALAIQEDRIEAVGDSAEIRNLAGSSTRQVDLGGRTVIPGLNDAHNHMRIRPADLVELEFASLNPKRPEVMQAISTAVSKFPTGTFLTAPIGTAIFRDPTVDRASLDLAAPNHPVILTTFTGHASILNSAALAKLGIGENEPDPLGGRYEHSQDGKLSGVLREYASVRVSRGLADLTSDKDAIVELRQTLADAAEHGITTLQAMSEKMPPTRYVDLLKQVPTSIRVRIMRMPMTTSSGRDLSEGQSVPRNPSPLITVSGTEWLLDGVPFEGTFAPRQGMASSSATHAEPFFGNLQRAGGEKVWATRRVRFEHGDALFPDLIPRVKQLGIIVVEQGTHLDIAAMAPEVMPSIRAEKSQPMQSLLAAGIPLVLS